MMAKELKRRFTVGLVQFNSSFPGENYLPLSVGMLQAYAKRQLAQPENYEFLLPLYRRIPVGEAVDHMLGADVAFFSTYVWNYRISLEVARALKEKSPDTVIAFGGPSVPDRVEPFLNEQTFIDLACHGEGEKTALAILENLDSKNWDRISGVSFLRENGTLVSNPKSPRMGDLNEFPSPYVEGVFDPLMKAHPSERWLGAWETNRGCPFSCAYCDWGSAVNAKVYSFDLDRLYKEMEWFAQNKVEYIYCCDANFGMLPRDIEIAHFVAATKKKYGYPNAMSVQGTKNATERAYQVQKILADAGLSKGVDLALQSMDETTLINVKRANISSETYQELQRRFTKDGVETSSEVILGLPGETYESFTNGVSAIIENGQHNRIQFHSLSILPNAELADPEYLKKFGIITVESKVVNRHGSLEESGEEIDEYQTLVVGNNSMPKDVWVKSRAFAWITDLYYFDKTLQIPIILLHEACDLSYRDLLEEFLEGSLEPFPILEEIRSFFLGRAEGIQAGGPEMVSSKEWMNLWWPAHEYMLIKLCVENKLEQFHEEAEALLSRMLESRSLTLPEGQLQDAIELNRSLLKLPFQTEDLTVDLSYNIWEFYRSRLAGEDLALQNEGTRYQINRTAETWNSWDDWCREVIWYGNKRGAYLYGSDAVEPQIAGHY